MWNKQINLEEITSLFFLLLLWKKLLSASKLKKKKQQTQHWIKKPLSLKGKEKKREAAFLGKRLYNSLSLEDGVILALAIHSSLSSLWKNMCSLSYNEEEMNLFCIYWECVGMQLLQVSWFTVSTSNLQLFA